MSRSIVRENSTSRWCTGAKLIILSLFVISSLCGPLACAQEEPAKRVLVLNSYHKGFVQTDNIVKGIESVLKPGENDIELRIEYMDSKATQYETQYKERLYDLYKYKYGNQQFDVIISSDDNAFDFLREYHEDLFPGTPIVFCGVNNMDAPNLINPDVFTGIIELHSIRETIDLGLELHPETRQIVFVVDNTPTGVYLWSQIQGLFEYYENTRMTRIDDSLSMGQIEDEVSKLSDDTIVLFGTFNRDNSGKYYSFEEAAARVSKASARPMYGYSIQILPYGIVGGKLFGGFYHGQVAAKMAQRILMGEKVRGIPVLTEPQTQYVFNYEQMERWGIEVSDLPEDSIVINKPHSFYEENKELIWGIIAVMTLQTLTIIGLLVNVSRRKRAEEALKEYSERLEEMVKERTTELRESEEKMRAQYKGIPVPTYSWQRVEDDLVLVDYNDAAVAITQGKIADFVGITASEMYQNLPEIRDEIEICFEKQIASEREMSYWYQSTGEHKHLAVKYAFVPPDLVLVHTEDITGRKEMQERLVRSEKLAILGQLAGGVGHELRNPLGVISNAIYFLQMTLPDADEATREYLDIISSEVRGAEKIVSDLLDFSRTWLADREEIAVSNLVSQVLERRPPPENVEVTTEIPSDLPPVFVDPRQMGQVMGNLVTNAYQAMPDGGRLIICVSEDQGIGRRGDKGTRRQGDSLPVSPSPCLRVSISDTGCGIPEENMKNIFEPLFTTKARGIGLGLAVSKNLVEANGGSIEMESEMGKGSTFMVKLPSREKGEG